MKLVNTGVCSIFFGTTHLMPGDEIEVESIDGLTGVEYLIAKGDLAISGDAKKTKAIKENHEKTRRKSPTEGKSASELEDGGEFK